MLAFRHIQKSAFVRLASFRSATYQELFDKYQNEKYNVELFDEPTIPILRRKPDELLLKNDWSETPFNRNEDLKVPYFDLFTGEFMGKSVALEHEFFNVPLRRDLVHRAYIYYLKYDMRFDWAAKTMEDIAGSKRKIMKQKGSGSARQGRNRSPTRMGGPKAHGRRKKMHRIALPYPIRHKALLAAFTSRLAEGRLRIASDAEIEEISTKRVYPIVKADAKTSNILLLTEKQPCKNFMMSQRAIKNLTCIPAEDATTFDIINHDRLIITSKGLSSLTKRLLQSQIDLTAPAIFDRTQLEIFERPTLERPVYDPSRELKLKFPILQQYLNDSN